MNKTLLEIVLSIIGLKEQNGYLQELNSTSKASIWRNLLETIAFAIFSFQEAAELHLKEIDEKIANQKVPRLPWYRGLALAFQYGFDWLEEFDRFSTTYEDNGVQVEATPEQVEASKIIKYVAVTRNRSNMGRIVISMKIAGENTDEVLSDEKALAFKKYIEETQCTGDDIVIVNFLPDILKLDIKICYDPLVLLPNGMSIVSGKFPVQNTINRFLLNLPFNGELSVQTLLEAIKATEGVIDLNELSVQSKWIEPGVGYGQFQPIEISRIPKSGRFKIEDWSGVTYINYQPQE
ncbi:nucleotidyltransferase [Chryseobacterium sp. KCF3-3]|uniref:nucleotidyltransferase n=1 Tax=Chryseobacterium sp. KCF3-3 TaxID=3231511 RepID=UPI0038B23ADF